MAAFITKESFTEKASIAREEEKVFNWCDLEVDGEIYKVENIEEKEGKFGICYILHTITQEGFKNKIWSPTKLSNQIQKKQNKITYFTSLGQVHRKGRTYNNFDVVFEEQ